MASRFEAKRTLGLALIAGWTLGCATPEGPRGRTAQSDPACLAAEPPPPAELGAALVEDPPLPGETKRGWPAPVVELPQPAVGGAAHGEGHHGHAH